jgi:uncharacterized membrane protein
VIMALDHVRDYFMVGGEQDPLTNPTVGAALFFTRWITHFCAPVFVFLAGSSAGLTAARKTPSELGAFLAKRGMWLIVVEVAIVSNAWSFAPQGVAQLGGQVVIPMQVIWAIGASMVVLAGAQFFGRRACLVIGGAILVGHNFLDPIWPATSGVFDTAHPLWVALHAQMAFATGPVLLAFVYPLLPWIGVMLLGFGSSRLFQATLETRDIRLLAFGGVVTTAFVLVRASGVYGDPNPWQVQSSGISTLIDFVNVTKYPPSLLFLLMTLSPAAMLCASAGHVPDAARQRLVVFGRVPFAFYVAHLYLIHTLAVVVGVVSGFEAHQFLTFSFFFPAGYGVGLPGVYLAWAIVVTALYPLCRWVAAVKARRHDWWLSYL